MPSSTRLEHLPLALSLAAVVVAVFGLTPFGVAASRAIRHVAFAQDSDRVGGLRVSANPRSGRLVPLDAYRRLPPAAIRAPAWTGPAGAVGERGATGPAGIDGGEAVVRRRDVSAPLESGQDLLHAELSPGSWVLMAAVELSVTDGDLHADLVRCGIFRGGVELGYGRATIGTGVGGTRAVTVGAIAASEQTSTAGLLWRCTTDAAVPVQVGTATLSALRVEALR